MMSAKLASLLFVLVGIIPLVQALGKVLSWRRFGRHGLLTTGTVIDHVIKDKHGRIVVEFKDRQGRRNTFISEPRNVLNPVSDHVKVRYLPDEPGNAQVVVAASKFARSVIGDTLWGLTFVAAGIVLFIVT